MTPTHGIIKIPWLWYDNDIPDANYYIDTPIWNYLNDDSYDSGWVLFNGVVKDSSYHVENGDSAVSGTGTEIANKGKIFLTTSGNSTYEPLTVFHGPWQRRMIENSTTADSIYMVRNFKCAVNQSVITIYYRMWTCKDDLIGTFSVTTTVQH